MRKLRRTRNDKMEETDKYKKEEEEEWVTS
jgi:hypothetical protein